MNQSAHQSYRVRGAMLVQMMVAIALLSVFMLIAIKLAHTTMTIIERYQQPPRWNEPVDEAIEQIRRDVWNAYEVGHTNSSSVIIKMNEQHQIVWSMKQGEGKLERSKWSLGTKESARLYDLPGGEMTFARHGHALVVHLESLRNQRPLGTHERPVSAHRPDQRFICQRLLLDVEGNE